MALAFLMSAMMAFAQVRTITGTVTDNQTNETLPGASVLVKGTTKGASADMNGKFSLSLAPTENILVVSFIGYQSTEVTVGNQTTLNIRLEPARTTLQELVVVGYGTQKKLEVTGAVAQVKGDDISKQASVNPISALQGKVAGVQITNSGSPGASPQIKIRGIGTVYGSANPLYVVDGVWYDDISFLPSSDIESINILKDASSESIFGIRAANGVVLITTKKGKKSTLPTVTYNGYIGNQVVTNQIKMADGPQFATLINELDAINGVTPRYPNPTAYGTTDWYHQILGNAMTTSHQVSVAGGGENSTYNFSLGYLKQDGIVKTNTFDRYTARLQNDFQIFKFMKVGYALTGSVNTSNDIDGGIFHQLYAAAPIVPVYYADDTYGDPNDFNMGNSNAFNPQVTMDFFRQKSTNYRLTGNMYGDVTLMKDLTFRTSIGADYGQNEVKNYTPEYTATLAQRNSISKLAIFQNETRNWLIENTLTYDTKIGDHGIKLLAGQAAQYFQYYYLTASGSYVPDLTSGDHYLRLSDVSTRYVEDDGSIKSVSSYFGRMNYTYKNKYLITLAIRADGTSVFTGDDTWGIFPSLGAGWVISEEAFMKDIEVVNTLKLRGSWGKIGNMSVPANLSTLTVNSGFVYVGGNGSTSSGASITSIVPPVTHWEHGVGTDIGLEASLLNDRLYAEVDWYDRRTVDAIFPIPILGSLGTTSGTIIGNQATFQNRGIEFMVSWKDRFSDDFSYSVSGNMSFNHNKVLEVPSGANAIYQAVGTTGSNNFNTRTIVGEPIGQFFGLKVIGVFQSQAEIDAYTSNTGAVIMPNAAPGDFKYSDENKDGVIDDKDRIVLGNPNPKLTYGFNTTWTYKAFDLTLDLQGVAGVEVYNANIGLRYGTENFSLDFYENRWHGEGTSNSYCSANIGGGMNYRSNSFYVESGSYFRVRNAQLGYTLPASLTDRFKIDKFRVYVNAQNALNIFKYKGFSPEIGGGPTLAGVDVNVYPLYATYNVGVNVTF